jgi:aminoglycoside phosphotransferase (APT) family kinase protein
MTDAHPTTAETAARLTTLLVGLWGAGSVVDELVVLSGGASRESYRVDARGPDGARRPLLLRMDWVQNPGLPPLSREAEATAVANGFGVPVSHIISWSAGPEQLGAPFMLVDFIEGETISRKIIRDDEYRAARRVFAEQCGTALAAIHAIPASELSDLPQYDPLDEVWRTYSALDRPRPVIEYAFKRLAETRPASDRLVVVHGDFRLGNLMVDADGIAAVLDWERVHLGDALEDFGWLCTRAWRYGQEAPVGGIGEYAALFDAYERHGGQRIDPAAVRWWELLGTLRWGVICMRQAQRHLSGETRSIELATIGRRVSEQEFELVNSMSTEGQPA